MCFGFPLGRTWLGGWLLRMLLLLLLLLLLLFRMYINPQGCHEGLEARRVVLMAFEKLFQYRVPSNPLLSSGTCSSGLQGMSQGSELPSVLGSFFTLQETILLPPPS